MPLQARLMIKNETTIYHLVSRTALDGFVLGEKEKDELLKIIQHMSSVYFIEIFGFCIMGNHFHLVVKMKTGDGLSADSIKRRYKLYQNKEKSVALLKKQIPAHKEKWSSLSEYMREIKQRFSRYYNREHNRRGFFWSQRFKSVIVESGNALINCLAYIDLNPVRAGIVDSPEKYKWCSLGYHTQANSKGKVLSLNLGIEELKGFSKAERLKHYKKFVYKVGDVRIGKGSRAKSKVIAKGKKSDFEKQRKQRFQSRCRYFTDSGVIGSKEFVAENYQTFKDYFKTEIEKKPKTISGLEGVYSLKRLTEIKSK